MPKKTILFILFFASQLCYSQINTNSIEFKNNHFYLLNKIGNEKLIIFLHGGVRNPYFKENNSNITLDYLFENNRMFTTIAHENKFDILIPITNDSLNWVDNYEYCFFIFKKYIETLTKKYNEIYISGFSDGGTGSFKIFYSHPNDFNGLIVFNGYPNHKNFNTKINHSEITNKKILFCSTKNDHRIPYEFLLSEYYHQKKYNPNTFIKITKGKHTFRSYDKENLRLIFEIIVDAENKKTEQLQGLIINDKLVEFYTFRKKIIRKYNFGKEIYNENKRQKKVNKNVSKVRKRN